MNANATAVPNVLSYTLLQLLQLVFSGDPVISFELDRDKTPDEIVRCTFESKLTRRLLAVRNLLKLQHEAEVAEFEGATMKEADKKLLALAVAHAEALDSLIWFSLLAEFPAISANFKAGLRYCSGWTVVSDGAWKEDRYFDDGSFFATLMDKIGAIVAGTEYPTNEPPFPGIDGRLIGVIENKEAQALVRLYTALAQERESLYPADSETNPDWIESQTVGALRRLEVRKEFYDQMVLWMRDVVMAAIYDILPKALEEPTVAVTKGWKVVTPQMELVSIQLVGPNGPIKLPPELLAQLAQKLRGGLGTSHRE